MGMTTHAAGTVTADELLRLPDDSLRRELITGELRVTSPAGAEHGRVAMTAGRLLSTHVHNAGVGATLPRAPDFAIEVVSPEDSRREVESKAFDWLRGGTAAVLVLNPKRRTAAVYRAPDRVTFHDLGDEIDLSDAVPGWRVAVADFFE